MMKMLSEYYSDNRDLRSTVYLEGELLSIYFYKYDRLLEIREMPDSTYEEVSNVAENFVLGC